MFSNSPHANAIPSDDPCQPPAPPAPAPIPTFEAVLLDGQALVTISFAPQPVRPPRTMVFVVDVSGSMGVEATVNEGGVQCETGQSVLQLVGEGAARPPPRRHAAAFR